MNVFDHIRQHIYESKGLIPFDPAARFQAILKSEWSQPFETFMRNRLAMGCLRYGPICGAGKKPYDRVAAAHKRLDLYTATGNLEHLVDVANTCLLEFHETRHPKAHFTASDESIGYELVKKPN